MTTTQADTQALDELCINTIRTLSMDAVQKANSGHAGAPMALAPLAYTLYTRVMKHNPADADWFDRDRFVLSAGHASMLLYSSLYLAGYGLTLDDLKSFRQLGSPTARDPEYGEAAGVEATNGPLGQGISIAVGMALAGGMLADRYNRPDQALIDHNTYAVASDGDVQEGVASEACSFAGHLGLGKLVVFYDNNHIQLGGPTALAFSEDVGKRFEAYGWHVHDQGEDLSVEGLESAVETAKGVPEQPSLVILRTHIGFGAPNLQDTNKAHGSPLGEEEVKLTKEALGWPAEPPFMVPDEALKHFRDAAAQRGQLQSEWQQLAESYRSQNPELWEELSLVIERKLPDGWDAEVPEFRPEIGRIATRKASNQVIQWAAERVPNLISGSADLEPSTLTLIDDGGAVERGDYNGRNVHYGVREHGMAAIVNGLNLHGLRAFGSTFFNFLDYMKGALRMAAIMELPAIAVFTHDSIGLGEDGPTHQPIEQLAHLRATPNLYMVRPSDANETALAWQFALGQTEVPVAFALSRQGLPIWSPDDVPADAIERGAYVLRDSPGDGDPDVILIGTGSEVSICVEAAELLEADGIATRVVSAPCLERFGEQPGAYRDSVLPPNVRARVSVEAATPLGWDRWTTDDGDQVAMRNFGASAPQPVLYEHFGFTGEAVAGRAKTVLDRLGARA